MLQERANQIVMLLIAVTLSVVFFYVLFTNRFKRKQRTEFVIGILQTTSHPALDVVRDNFIKTVKTVLKNNVSFIVQNAYDSHVNAYIMARRLSWLKSCTLLVALGTPAAQALVKAERVRPIIFAAVADPASAGILSLGKNVTGVSAMIDAKREVSLISVLLPHVKKVAVLYTHGEPNSSSVAQRIIQQLEEIGLVPFEVALSHSFELIPALHRSLKNADVVITPTDNYIACAIKLIVSQALIENKPVIVSDNLLVRYGALAACGINYIENGEQAGRVALDIICNKKKPADIPVRNSSYNNKITVNAKMAKRFGVVIPPILIRQVILENSTA